MLMVLVVGITVLAHFRPFEDSLSQSMQVGSATMIVTLALNTQWLVVVVPQGPCAVCHMRGHGV